MSNQVIPCACDLHKVLLPFGCQCGAIEKERAQLAGQMIQAIAGQDTHRIHLLMEEHLDYDYRENDGGIGDLGSYVTAWHYSPDALEELRYKYEISALANKRLSEFWEYVGFDDSIRGVGEWSTITDTCELESWWEDNIPNCDSCDFELPSEDELGPETWRLIESNIITPKFYFIKTMDMYKG